MVSESPYKPAKIPEQKEFDGKPFPLILEPSQIETMDQVLTWARSEKTKLGQLLKENGAILFRGFPFQGPEHFNDFCETLGIEPLPYVGGAAPRNTVYKHVHTTNESPPHEPIPFHHEMAQVPLYPECLFFFCLVPSAQGGETPILKSDVIYQRVNQEFPEFTRELEEKGVVYTRIIPEETDPESAVGRGWKDTFQAQDRETATKNAANINVRLEFLPNGDCKTVSPILPAIKTPPKLGRKMWFNSMIAAYTGCVDKRNDPKKAVVYGDGTYLNDEHAMGTAELMKELCVAIPWQKGDVMWIDNNQVLHSRRNFVPPRKIMAFLGKNCPYE